MNWPGDTTALADDLRRSLRGEVRFDAGHRALYATDASNYRQVPIGVVFPVDDEDLIAAVAACRRHGAPVVQRGGGYQPRRAVLQRGGGDRRLRHLTGVREIDPARRTARVPGTVLDDLRGAASATGSPSAPIPPPTAGARSAG